MLGLDRELISPTGYAGGRALLMLTPGEAAGMRGALEAAAIPTKPLRMNPSKTLARCRHCASRTPSSRCRSTHTLGLLHFLPPPR